MEIYGGTYDIELLQASGGQKEVKKMIAHLHSTSELTFTSTRPHSGEELTEQNTKLDLSSNGKDATVTWEWVSTTNMGDSAEVGLYFNVQNAASFAIVAELPYITQKPKITANMESSAGEWNRSTKAKINITELYSANADVSLVCDGKELLTKKYIVQNNSIADEIELNGLGIKNGSKLEWGVTLPGGTEARTEMNMTNVDVTGPILNTGLESNSNWAKTRNLNVNYHDEGVGNDRVYLANTDYIYGTKEGENSEDVLFELTGDVYSEKELNVFAVDSLGNYTVNKIIVNKLDNTVPTITKAIMQGSKLVITSNDEKEGLGEGSGVAKYRYITSTERIENPQLTSENSFEVNKDDEIRLSNLNEANFVYIVAEDLAGNVSDVYELRLQDLVLTSKVNLDLAEGKGGVELDWSGFDATNIYFVIYKKEESAENFEKIVDLEDKFSNNTYTDILGNDKAKPVAPTVNVGTNSSEIQINLASSDNGTTYTYYVEAYDISTNTLLSSSNRESVKI